MLNQFEIPGRLLATTDTWNWRVQTPNLCDNKNQDVDINPNKSVYNNYNSLSQKWNILSIRVSAKTHTAKCICKKYTQHKFWKSFCILNLFLVNMNPFLPKHGVFGTCKKLQTAQRRKKEIKKSINFQNQFWVTKNGIALEYLYKKIDSISIFAKTYIA